LVSQTLERQARSTVPGFQFQCPGEEHVVFKVHVKILLELFEPVIQALVTGASPIGAV
jgi:hypothetical protein